MIVKITQDRNERIRRNRRHTLFRIIVDDLFQFGKLPLCLFICIIATAVMVVTATHYTRLLTAQHDQLIQESNALDIEWRNLVLKENVLGDHRRVEQIAKEKLQMQHIDPLWENIIVVENKEYVVHGSNN